MTKIYISPSTQDWNRGVGTYGTEEQRMNQLADLIVPLLRDNGFTVYRNRPEMTLEQVVQDSKNKIGSDGLHVALHTNAGGGKGTEIYFYDGSSKSKKLAQSLYDFIAPETKSPDRGIKPTKSLRELNGPDSPSALIEYVFHDNPEDVADILSTGEMKRLAVATVRGIVKYEDKTYVEKTSGVTPTVNDTEGIFRIKTGIFRTARSFADAVDKIKADFGVLVYEAADSMSFNPDYRIYTGTFTTKEAASAFQEQIKKKYGWITYLIDETKN